MQTPDEILMAKRLAPAIKTFTDAVADAGLIVSALVFDPEGEFLIKAGNCPHRGIEFVRLHSYLSMVVAQLDEMGHFSDASITDAPRTVDPAEIALRMATAIVQVPEDLVPARVRDLANEYFEALS